MSDSEDIITEEMRIDPQRVQQLTVNIQAVRARIEAATSKGQKVRLTAVSKLKPPSDILSLHQAPGTQLHFGENYLPELRHKARLLPRTVRWHFIGALQSNKCKPLASQIPNLWAVESVDSAKKATLLDLGRADLFSRRANTADTADILAKIGFGDEGKQLRVFVQINTSGEETKFGVEPKDAVALCRHVLSECPHLHLQGLMTIGAIARSHASANANVENEDFTCLKDVRDTVVRELQGEFGDAVNGLELSMGMSEDFEGAIRLGSDEVRVGSGIFGGRMGKEEAKEVREKIKQAEKAQ